MIMIVAAGTSTPTSTDRRRHQHRERAVGESRHDGVFFGGGETTVNKADLIPEDFDEILPSRLGGGDVELVGLGDQGADPEGLGALRHGIL